MANLLLRLRSLLAELRRRRVFRVAAVYAAAAFTVGQAVSVAFPALHLPAWTVTFAVASLLAGFPVALLLAWAFDITLARGGGEEASSTAHAADHEPAGNAQPGTLRPQPTPFVGRERELDEITTLLDSAACRMVTITGPGGVGKTRLAVRAAEERAAAFSHGVRFVPLVALREADSLISTIAEHLGLPLSAREEPRLQLLDYLREKQLLLVLDNFEHLAKGGGLLAEILEYAPGVKIVVTSRERLNLRGETTIAIGGLEYPRSEHAGDAERFDAVRLFVQGARRVDPSFSLKGEDVPAVVRVCRRVEGIPLAIELAAAWARALSCSEIAAEIEHNHDFLAGALRDVPERHRSLRAVFESSWRLLTDEEKRAFRRMSVFRGGFRRAAAEQVTGASLALLTELLDQSLLRRSATGRFEVLEVLRQHAQAKLAEDRQEEFWTRQAHCDYYAERLSAIRTRLDGPEEKEALAYVGEEIENIRPAWRWAAAEESPGNLARSLESLFVFYDSRGWAREGAEVFGLAIDRVRRRGSDEAPGERGRDGVLARLLARQGVFYLRLGRYSDAAELLEQAVAVCREGLDSSELAFSLDKLGLLANEVGNYPEAKRLHAESLALYRELRDHRGTGRSLTHLGNVEYALGNYAAAGKLYREGLTVLGKKGDRSGVANSLCNLGLIAATEGKSEEAESFLKDGLAIAKELDNKRGIAQALQNLGCVASDAGRYSQAEAYLREGIDICREMGFRRLLAFCLNELGNVYNARQDSNGARDLYFQALATAVDIRETPLVVETLIGVVRLLARRAEERERALELLFVVLRHPASDQGTRDGAGRLLEELESEVPANTVAAAAERASSLKLEDVATELLDELRPLHLRAVV